MHTDGPEFQRGYRERMSLDGRQVVEARHVSHRRMPNGSEISRAVSRGRPFAMVESLSYEWVVVTGQRAVASIRYETNGTFSVPGDRRGNYRDLRKAVEASLPPLPKPFVEPEGPVDDTVPTGPVGSRR